LKRSDPRPGGEQAESDWKDLLVRIADATARDEPISEQDADLGRTLLATSSEARNYLIGLHRLNGDLADRWLPKSEDIVAPKFVKQDQSGSRFRQTIGALVTVLLLGILALGVHQFRKAFKGNGQAAVTGVQITDFGASYSFREDGRVLELKSGRIRVTCPEESGRDFTVRSRGLDIRHVGTVYEVDSSARSVTIDVLDGAVEIRDSESLEPTLVPANAAVSWSGETKHLSPKSLRSEDLSRDIAALRKGWIAHAQSIRADPSTRIHFGFDRELLPEFPVQEMSKLEVTGPSFGSARIPGKRGLRFERLEDFVQFLIPQELTEMTVLVWLRVDRLQPDEMSAILYPKGFQAGDFMLAVHTNGRIEMAPRLARCISTESVIRLGVWNCIGASVRIEPNGTVENRLYLNGEALESTTDYLTQPHPIRMKPAVLGGWVDSPNAEDGQVATRPFFGTLDELAIFDKVLSPEEIALFGRLEPQG